MNHTPTNCRLSYIITVLNSHGIVERQFLHWRKMDLPSDIEILLIDDGSDPPISRPSFDLPNLTIYATHDTRPWTITLARNQGVRLAKADYVLLTDIDHILLRDTLIAARDFGGDRMTFHREFGVIDEEGDFTQDIPTLLSYGLEPDRIKDGLGAPFHGDSFAIKKDLFWKAGGYSENDIIQYPPMGETHFRDAYRKLGASTHGYRPTIYLIPNGHYCGDENANPFGLFHDLSRKSRLNAGIRRKMEARRLRSVRDEPKLEDGLSTDFMVKALLPPKS